MWSTLNPYKIFVYEPAFPQMPMGELVGCTKELPFQQLLLEYRQGFLKMSLQVWLLSAARTRTQGRDLRRSRHIASLGPVAVSGACLDNLYLRGLLHILGTDLLRDLKIFF